MVPRKNGAMKGSAIAVIAILTLGMSVWPSGVAAEEKMTYEEFQLQLGAYQAREQAAAAQLAQLNEEIAGLLGEIEATKAQIEMARNEMFMYAGTDEAGFQAYLMEIEALSNDARGLAALSVKELWNRREEVERLAGRLEELQASPIGFIPEAATKLEALAGMVQRVQENLPSVFVDSYSVVRGDYLWKIAKKEDIYNDPYMWPRIFVSNRDQIKHPDLIYLKQVLDIPQGVERNQHLVQDGESLAMIAGYASVYGSPIGWVRIYEANRDQILDSNRIYPAQVLMLPPSN